MKQLQRLLLLVLFPLTLLAQTVQVPAYYEKDSDLSESLAKIISELKLNGSFYVGDEDGVEEISLAVIDLNGTMPKLGGVNAGNFIYPASVYKMYVAAQVLGQVSRGEYGLFDSVVVSEKNAVDKAKEISFDPRPLIRPGDTLTVAYLLDLMITRSDNTAANCLIDKARRKEINAMIAHYNWQGSEVTRKFLKRKFEDAGYEDVPGTETCALHAADFLYRVSSNQLISPWVSMQLKSLLGRQLDHSKLAQGLPPGVMFFNKTGWFSYWTNDVGIVDDGEVRYIIACFLPLEEERAKPLMKLLSERVYNLIKSRYIKG